MDMLVKYANNLEDLVGQRTRLLYEEKQKTEDLLHRMLPKLVSFLSVFEFSKPTSICHIGLSRKFTIMGSIL